MYLLNKEKNTSTGILYNKSNCSRILIGSHLGSIRGQTQMMSTTNIFPLCFKIAESFGNLNILQDWAKGKEQRESCQSIEQVRET